MAAKMPTQAGPSDWKERSAAGFRSAPVARFAGAGFETGLVNLFLAILSDGRFARENRGNVEVCPEPSGEV